VLGITSDTSSVGKDPQVSFDFMPGAQRVKKSDNGIPVHSTGNLGRSLVQGHELASSQLVAELSDIEGEEGRGGSGFLSSRDCRGDSSRPEASLGDRLGSSRESEEGGFGGSSAQHRDGFHQLGDSNEWMLPCVDTI
jgi:hypothetical protein